MKALVQRHFVAVPHGTIHLRRAGNGPPVLLLHDSPRSSVLHADLVAELGSRFTAIAPDTPGYGWSSRLPAGADIDAFGRALVDLIRALGLERPFVYAFHTSSKIALSAAVQAPDAIGRLILDGLSIPATLADDAFVDAYMSPFVADTNGAYVLANVTRARDLHRWFPWFDRRAVSRMKIDAPDTQRLHNYMLDLFSAGPGFADAYRPAMRYDARPALAALTVPTTVLAREDDVLAMYLETVERLAPPAVTIDRLPTDRAAWVAKLSSLFEAGTRDAQSALGAATSSLGPDRIHHIDGADLYARRSGSGTATPALFLPDTAAPSDTMRARQQAQSAHGIALTPDWPGIARSDPRPDRPDADGLADLLAKLLDREAIERVDIVADGLASILAQRFAARHPSRVGKVDATTPAKTVVDPARWSPPFALREDGGQFVEAFQRVRDEQLQFPWFDGSKEAIRPGDAPLDAADLHARMLAILRHPTRYGDTTSAALAAWR